MQASLSRSVIGPAGQAGGGSKQLPTMRRGGWRHTAACSAQSARLCAVTVANRRDCYGAAGRQTVSKVSREFAGPRSNHSHLETPALPDPVGHV